MTKEQLIAMGLSQEQATGVMAAFKSSIDGNFIPMHRFNEVNAQVKTLTDQIGEREAQIKDLKKFEGTAQELSEKITTLEKQNTEARTKLQTELVLERKRNAVKMELLQDAETRPHDADMVLGLFNLETIAFDETSGKITSGFKEQQENLRKDKAFLFATPTANSDKAPNKGFNPAGVVPGSGDGKTPGAETSESYGKSLAQTRLGMMGIKTAGADGNK